MISLNSSFRNDTNYGNNNNCQKFSLDYIPTNQEKQHLIINTEIVIIFLFLPVFKKKLTNFQLEIIFLFFFWKILQKTVVYVCNSMKNGDKVPLVLSSSQIINDVFTFHDDNNKLSSQIIHNNNNSSCSNFCTDILHLRLIVWIVENHGSTVD